METPHAKINHASTLGFLILYNPQSLPPSLSLLPNTRKKWLIFLFCSSFPSIFFLQLLLSPQLYKTLILLYKKYTGKIHIKFNEFGLPPVNKLLKNINGDGLPAS